MHVPARVRLAAYPTVVLVVIGFVSRPLLYAAFHEGRFSVPAVGLTVTAGAVLDALIGIVLSAPWMLAVATCRLRVLERRLVRLAGMTLVGSATTFLAVIEWFFFQEFNSRFNNVAIDYVRNPKEVLGNIHESFPVTLFVAGSFACGLAIAALGMRTTSRLELSPLSWRDRARGVALASLVVLSAWTALMFAPATVSRDRIVDEIARNGIERFIHAARTGNLDYALYYRTLPAPLARRRAAVVLDAGRSRVEAHDPRPWDVVVILEESLGSEFVGALGHPERKTTPGLDRWSREGLLLTNLTATGNRTVRGLEATLCSIVPLPAGAVLKRMRDEPVATLADVYRQEGYRTAFVYGGWGRFDDMKPFFPRNGFEEFIERDAYPDDAFSTIWGVADEWIFDQALARQKSAEDRQERLFMTILTVSNHRPFRVPERGTSWPAAQQVRESAVAYADWALAHYLDGAKAAGLLDHTLVLIEGDHGARVYGAESIPTPSYRIPGLFLVPDPAWRGRRIDRLASQIDLAPTLLALTGRPVPSPFLGEDLTHLPSDGGRAFVQHDRDVGLLTDHALVTLGLQHHDTCYTRSGRDSDVFTRAPACASSPALQSLEDDAAAVYQTADELLQQGSYTLPRTGTEIVASR